jgi:hypothetical protein
MSDFDEVLERLVTDPAFQAALRSDPGAALHGYRLDDEERELLQAQLVQGAGADRSVEERVSKSGIFGMVGPVVSALGLIETGSPGLSSEQPQAVAPPPEGAIAPGEVVFSAPPVSGEVVFSAADPGTAIFGEGGQAPGYGVPAVDYETRVNAGQGRWEEYRAVERGDGGVDILVDRDGDGAVDWVGHDYDRDGLLDNADYDTNDDGILDTRASDADGDGWFDYTTPYPVGDHGVFGSAGTDQP